MAELTRSLEATEAQLKLALAQGKQMTSERDGLERVSAKVSVQPWEWREEGCSC
jgi:hypothetical protein